MIKRFALIFVWTILSIHTLFFAMDRYKGILAEERLLSPYAENFKSGDTPKLSYGALPSPLYYVKTNFTTSDARPEIIRQYLNRYNSPLEPYAELLVKVADDNDFDYRWMVAIAQQESNLCKRIIPDSYNCWGWGIYGDKVTRFQSFPDAIVRIAPQFKDTFLKHPEIRPEEVMKTYTPPSDGSWAFGVNQFMRELE